MSHGIAVVGENHGRSVSENGVELVVRQTVGVLAVGLQAHQVDDVYHPDLECREARTASMSTAARVSSVGTSPQHAMTTSGSPPSFDAQSQIPIPRVQCRTASSIDR